MDVDAVVTEVARAVGLAEGRSGVTDIIRAISRHEPAAARDISRTAGLPIPLVTAVCSELRKRGVVGTGRPVRLTPAGRAALGLGAPGTPRLSGRCPCCDGRGTVIPEAAAALAAELEELCAGGPGAKLELDQTHCTVATKVHRVLAMHEAGALDGTSILMLGDDDLTAVAVAAFAAMPGSGARIRRLAVTDTDPDVLGFIGSRAPGMTVELCQHDLREPLPAELAGGFDVVCTDPPYTVAGAELFLSRAVSALSGDAGQHIFFSFGARRPEETLRVQQLIAELGLAVRSLQPGFNTYQGAGILGGTSNLFHLRATSQTRPVITGSYPGPLYSARQRARPYQCAACKTVRPVGPGEQFQQISELKAAGCPDCAGTVFRPMPLERR